MLEAVGSGRWILAVVLICGACSDPETLDPGPTPFVLDAPTYFGEFEEDPTNPLTEEGIELGRMLFYEKRLSGDNTMSCATCHMQEFAFSEGKQFSTGIDGSVGTKNAMSVANLAWTNRFFWNGRASTLEHQALEPIENPIEMKDDLDDVVEELSQDGSYRQAFRNAFGKESIEPQDIGKAIAQFMKTMISSDSRYDRYVQGQGTLTDQELRGMELFFTHPDPGASIRGGNCGDCHSNFLTSGSRFGFDGLKNNGLDTDQDLEPGLESVTGRSEDRGKFKVPTLRNIALTAPYMHDGRFTTLEEVLDHYNENIRMSSTLDVLILEASNEEIVPGEPVKLHLTAQEKEDIIAFLHTLTDETFTSNEKFSDPFN